jgi:ankyrin repeat protein
MKNLALILILWLFDAQAVHQNYSSDFLALEAEFIAEEEEVEDDLELSLEEITQKDLNLTKDQALMWKRDQERRQQGIAKQKLIEKRRHINYKVSPALPAIIAPDKVDNSHLPGNLYQQDYSKIAQISAKNGDINGLRVALDHRVDINSRDQEGNTLLIIAVKAGKIDTVRLLLARRANQYLTDAQGKTPLHLATVAGYKKIRNSLLAMSYNAKKDVILEDLYHKKLEAAAAEHEEKRQAAAENAADLTDEDALDAKTSCPVCPVCTIGPPLDTNCATKKAQQPSPKKPLNTKPAKKVTCVNE